MPKKREFRTHGHSTSISLEQPFWKVLEFMADNRKTTLPDLIKLMLDKTVIANDKNLSSCLRVICLKYINLYTD